MSSGRRAHYADFVRVDTPLGRVAAHKAHGLFGISKRNLVLSLRQTIFEHHVCNALVVEPLRHIVSFVSGGLPHITSAGAYHNCLAVWFLGFVYCDAGVFGEVVVVDHRAYCFRRGVGGSVFLPQQHLYFVVLSLKSHGGHQQTCE